MTESNTHSTDEPLEGAVQAEPAESADPGPDADAPSGKTLGGPAANTTEKDPEDWVTGDEPMTGAQESYLDTLARQAGEEISADLTKAEASEHIDRLQQATGREGSDA